MGGTLLIVNQIDGGWEIIYQPAHALLSAQAATRWRPAARPVRWAETLQAIGQHDNGWQAWERAPGLTPAGAPRNFTEQSLAESIAQWERGITRGLHQGRWIALLISLHACRLYEARRGESRTLALFLDGQAQQQARWRAALNVSAEEAMRAYALLRWCDWFSLILCWRRLPPEGTPINVGEGPDGVKYEMHALPDGRVQMAPWPFEGGAFTVSVEARHLHEPHFADSEALAEALAEAPLHSLSWEMAP